jgi:hypothetical protein
MPFERTLSRLSLASWLLARGKLGEAGEVAREAARLAGQYAMRLWAGEAEAIIREARQDEPGARRRP